MIQMNFKSKFHTMINRGCLISFLWGEIMNNSFGNLHNNTFFNKPFFEVRHYFYLHFTYEKGKIQKEVNVNELSHTATKCSISCDRPKSMSYYQFASYMPTKRR